MNVIKFLLLTNTTECTLHYIHQGNNEEMNHKKGNILDTQITCAVLLIFFVITEVCSKQRSINQIDCQLLECKQKSFAIKHNGVDVLSMKNVFFMIITKL